MSIEVSHVTKRFKDFVALDDVSLEVRSGELLALLGPSGSGKTTLLRIIAGLDFPDAGRVLLDGAETTNQPVKDRHVGFVFQHYALFKHMTVFENVAFGLRVRPKKLRAPDSVIRQKVMNLLDLVHLDRFYDRYPAQLSGGQRQRVALARALAVEPKVLLLDEPFGALDAKVRKELRMWMRRLHDNIHITSVFVTHDQEEAMEVADRVVVMSNGRIEQVGTPEEVYHSPGNSFVYDFLGNYNAFDGWKGENGDVHIAEEDVIEKETSVSPEPSHGGWLRRYPEIGSFLHRLVPDLVPQPQSPPRIRVRSGKPKNAAHSRPVKLFARPHEMYVASEPDAGHEYILTKVLHVNPAGSLVKLELERRNGSILQAEIPKEVVDKLGIKKRDMIYVRPKRTKVFE